MHEKIRKKTQKKPVGGNQTKKGKKKTKTKKEKWYQNMSEEEK